jgi:hypothetical protein
VIAITPGEAKRLADFFAAKSAALASPSGIF